MIMKLLNHLSFKLTAAFLFIALLLTPSPSYLWAQEASESIRYARQLSGAFQNVAERITPSVVNISSRKSASNISFGGGGNSLGPLREFFGDEFLRRFQPPQSPDGMLPHGMGTGVIIDKEGHIVTNNHVVDGADEVEVRLHNKKSYVAKVIGNDKRTDLAVIKIQADGLQPARLGKSSRLNIGEWVIAAGNPFGLDNSITAGIVSAKGRSIMGGNSYEDFIQTDAAINPGNSGGPLVNLDGEVVGINTAIFSRTGGYMGIGFAIPIDMASSIVESLLKDGRVIRGWLGVGIQNLNEGLAKSFNYPSTEGALVSHIDPDGPAAKGGVKQTDIIVRFNNEKIIETNQLRNLVASLAPGTRVEVDVIRNGRKQSLTFKIGELPGRLGGDLLDKKAESTSVNVGIQIEPLMPEIARQLGSNQTSGLIVMSVTPGGIAERSGIRPRDIILQIDGQPVSSVSDFNRMVTESGLTRGVRMMVESQGMSRFVFLQSR